MKIILGITAIFGILLIQVPALAYTDFKEEGKVILFGFPKKTKFKITYGELKKFSSTKLTVDKCNTVTLKSSKIGGGGLFKYAETFIIQGDDKTNIIARIPKTILDTQQASIDWDTVESNQYKYTCLDGVINPKISWITTNGIKFFKYGKPGSQSEKLFISNIPYSTVRLKTPDEKDAKSVTRNVSSDNCGSITIRDNPKYPNELLGQFSITERNTPYQHWIYDLSQIPTVTGRDPIKCIRYER